MFNKKLTYITYSIIPILFNTSFCEKTCIKIDDMKIKITTNNGEIIKCDSKGCEYTNSKNKTYSTQLLKIRFDEKQNIIAKICGFISIPKTFSFNVDNIKIKIENTNCSFYHGLTKIYLNGYNFTVRTKNIEITDNKIFCEDKIITIFDGKIKITGTAINDLIFDVEKGYNICVSGNYVTVSDADGKIKHHFVPIDIINFKHHFTKHNFTFNDLYAN